MAKTKKPLEAVNGAYTAVPHRLLDSVAFIGSTDRAKSLLFALMRQHNGSNNGRLHLVESWLAKQGWPSGSSNRKARNELIERGLIVQTTRGGLNAGANWFALTWLPISNFIGLEITANDYHQGAWGNCELQPTARRKPPQKRDAPAVHRRSATPTIGAVEQLATPTTGAVTALSDTSATPYTGNNVLLPLPPSKPARGSKRIVGKVGRSGIPKELHKPQAAENGGMMILSYQACKGCSVRYLQADFLPHHVAGYCTEECWHHEPRGVPTAEDIGWKNGIAAASQRKQIAPKSR
jgi:hypothetical protein